MQWKGECGAWVHKKRSQEQTLSAIKGEGVVKVYFLCPIIIIIIVIDGEKETVPLKFTTVWSTRYIIK